MIKIMVVDADPGVCEAVKKTFTYIGFSVLTAATAQKALAVMEKEQPKIIFLDNRLRNADGVDLLQEIKRQVADAVVILVVAKEDEISYQQAIAQGADACITKPFSRNYLRDVVAQKIGDILDQGGHAKTPLILVVDDEEGFRNTIKDFISNRYECDILEAADGDAAVTLAQQSAPDVVLLDIKMPGSSGIDVIGRIRQICPQSKIIVLSAWKSAEVVSQAIGMGAADYISKPVSLAALNEKLKNMLMSLGKLKLKRVERKA